MSHYCLHLFTKEFPTDEVIQDFMEPYYEYHYEEDEEDEEAESARHPAFEWDFWRLGGRFGGMLQLSMEEEDDDRYRWEYWAEHRRAGRLFRSYPLEFATCGLLDHEVTKRMQEDEVLRYMRRGGTLLVDGGWLPHVVNRWDLDGNCWAILTDDGTVFARKVWSGRHWVETPDFSARARLVMERCESDHYLTVIDFHD